MKIKAILGIVLCLAACVPLAYTLAQAPADAVESAATVERWEHLALEHNDAGLGGDLSRQINRLGREGWQLVGVTPISLEGTTVKTIYYFKRPL